MLKSIKLLILSVLFVPIVSTSLSLDDFDIEEVYRGTTFIKYMKSIQTHSNSKKNIRKLKVTLLEVQCNIEFYNFINKEVISKITSIGWGIDKKIIIKLMEENISRKASCSVISLKETTKDLSYSYNDLSPIYAKAKAMVYGDDTNYREEYHFNINDYSSHLDDAANSVAPNKLTSNKFLFILLPNEGWIFNTLKSKLSLEIAQKKFKLLSQKLNNLLKDSENYSNKVIKSKIDKNIMAQRKLVELAMENIFILIDIVELSDFLNITSEVEKMQKIIQNNEIYSSKVHDYLEKLKIKISKKIKL